MSHKHRPTSHKHRSQESDRRVHLADWVVLAAALIGLLSVIAERWL
jgi:hypothetical protein